MNLLDALIVVLLVVGAVGGYRLGFITRATSWLCLAAGLYVGIRVLPGAMHKATWARGTSALLLAVVVLGGFAFTTQALGFSLGNRLRPRRPWTSTAKADRVLGGVAGAAGAAIIVWLVVPLAARTPGTAASLTSNSAIARWLDQDLPDPPDTLGALQSVVGEGFPTVFDALRPTPALGPPPAESGLSAATAEQVAASVVKIQGVACNRIQDGTGFVVDGGLVVTNAHVVAGEDTTQLQRDDGTYVNGTVVAFDPARDLAVLRADALDRPPLTIGESVSGAKGGVFGHPGGEPLRIAPFAVARTVTALGRDIYNRAPTERRVLELSASLRPGDSGSALVDPTGTVVGVAFAVAPDNPDVAYALSTGELRDVLVTVRSATPVSTGECV